MRSIQRVFTGSDVYVISTDAPVSEAVKWMNTLRIGSLVVVEDDRVVGILTERDILVRIVGAARDPGVTPVSEIMSERVVTIAPDASIEEAVDLMRSESCRHLPVVADGRLRGLISLSDVTRLLVEEREAEIADLVGYITRP